MLPESCWAEAPATFGSGWDPPASRVWTATKWRPLEIVQEWINDVMSALWHCQATSNCHALLSVSMRVTWCRLCGTCPGWRPCWQCHFHRLCVEKWWSALPLCNANTPGNRTDRGMANAVQQICSVALWTDLLWLAACFVELALHHQKTCAHVHLWAAYTFLSLPLNCQLCFSRLSLTSPFLHELNLIQLVFMHEGKALILGRLSTLYATSAFGIYILQDDHGSPLPIYNKSLLLSSFGLLPHWQLHPLTFISVLQLSGPGND